MWGNISAEAVHQFNFNTGFSSNKSDVLIHLAQWQYWWWFWFTGMWSFYFFFTNKAVKQRSIQMRPVMNTSFRTHAKWGDFVAAVTPVLWCLNIITNSTIILRMIEWQNESSLFTIRIRARQWYWIYKFELKNFTDILTSPKNIGRNRWQINTFGDLQTADDYLHVLQLRSQNKWIKKYWSDVLKKSNKTKKMHIVSPQEQFKINVLNLFDFNKKYDTILNVANVEAAPLLNTTFFDFDKQYSVFNNNGGYLSFLNNKKSVWENRAISDISAFNLVDSKKELIERFLFDDMFDLKKKKENFKNKTICFNLYDTENKNNKSNSIFLYNHADFNETSRWLRRGLGNNSPVRVIKYPLNLVNDNFNSTSIESTDTVELFRFRFNIDSNTIKHKVVPHTTYLAIKQKRYKRKKNIGATTKFYKDSFGNKTKKVRYSGRPFLLDNSIFVEDFGDPTKQYRLVKKNKVRHEVVPVTLAKRLLRVKRTLVVPAHVNITFITNSYDVIHSWFIPGLGIKIDCVPGRSTHHTFYIDNVGFYYGLCAEICGRYHHHMPIRVCALPFEHFLVWWQTFGISKLLFTTNQKRFENYYAFRKYVW